ncbi:MAG: hypothetical protein FWG25_00375 [Promicromonosporaceae bacterium]|nr:hypothetical protein [Promicromonosporaceae bacterium]
MSTKVRKTLTLDPEVVAMFDDDDAALSTAVNAVLHAERARRERLANLQLLVDDLTERWGPADPEDVAYFSSLFNS